MAFSRGLGFKEIDSDRQGISGFAKLQAPKSLSRKRKSPEPKQLPMLFVRVPVSCHVTSVPQKPYSNS